MSRPRNCVRILRALRVVDWITSEDLLDTLDVPRGGSLRSSYQHSLRVLLSKAQVERDAHAWPYRYRITADGRAAIANGDSAVSSLQSRWNT